MSKHIYLDYAAATPLDQRVFKAMVPYLSDQFYNPSAPYQPARDVRAAVEAARAECAHCLGAKPAEIIFTAGVTESINLAFHGVLKHGGHCVVSAIEHASVLETARLYDHSIMKINEKGRLLTGDIVAKLRDDTKLVSIGMVNNEIGVVQDIPQIVSALAAVRKKRLAQGNLTPLYFHTDATQAVGQLSVVVNRLGVDLLTLGGNKIYGPKQTGLLYKASHVALTPLIQGSGQEQNLRSGTENVAGIIGLAAALKLATKLRQSENTRLTQLKAIFVKQLVDMLPETVIIGDHNHSSPHIMMAAWPGLDAERLLFKLEEKGVLVNTGAACAAKKDGHSHVLKALGLSDNVMVGSLRFSFGRSTTESQLTKTAKIIKDIVTKERGHEE